VFIFCILTLTPAYQTFLEWEVVWSAALAHGILSAFSDGGSVISGATLLRGEEAILDVKTKCSGLYFCWLLCAAILPFPAPWGLRIAGAVLGSLILVGLNILRVISLFLVGCYYPGWFPAAHEQAWPFVSLLTTMVLMGAWLVWVKQREEAA
jgi:exosortase/archaeosortase family protein